MHLLYKFHYRTFLNDDSSSGFTLPEILVSLLIIGLLAGVLLPNWLAFIELRKLNAAQDRVYFAMRQAKSQATKDKLSNQISFREQSGVVQWAVHKTEAGVFIPNSVASNPSLWHSLEPTIQIDKELNLKGKTETTIQKNTSQNLWRVVFNYQGCPVYNPGDECTSTSLQALGQITLYSNKAGKARRCVYVSTILGAMRKGNEHSKVNENDKYCY